MKEKMKAYLAGPMRGIKDYNLPAFNAAAEDLRERGWDVYNPADLGTEQGDDPRSYLAQELPFICTEAKAVWVLPGWENSQGACLEVQAGRVCGLPIFGYAPLSEGGGELIPHPHDVDVLIEELHAEVYDIDRAHEAAEKKESVCQEADRLVSTDRAEVYGHPLDDFTKVVEAAKALGINPLEGPEHHALYWIIAKLARLSNSPGHRDSVVDICGYAKTYEMVLEERERRNGKDLGPDLVHRVGEYTPGCDFDAEREGWQ